MTPALRLRVRRLELGMTYTSLAEESGVNVGHLHSLEHGNAPMDGLRWRTLVSLAKALKMKPAKLMAEE